MDLLLSKLTDGQVRVFLHKGLSGLKSLSSLNRDALVLLNDCCREAQERAAPIAVERDGDAIADDGIFEQLRADSLAVQQRVDAALQRTATALQCANTALQRTAPVLQRSHRLLQQRVDSVPKRPRWD
jgi:hypothetical protein